MQYHPNATLQARVLVHELFHFYSGFIHHCKGWEGWDDEGYLTAQPENLADYNSASKEKVSCAVADWIVSQGGKPNPLFVDPKWKGGSGQ